MTQFADSLTSLLLDIAKIVVSGSIGGFIGGRIALRQFQLQAKFQSRHNRYLEQINALREILVILPVIFRDIHLKWELPSDSQVTSKQHITDLTNQIINTRSLFLSDTKVAKILDSVYSLIGESLDAFLLPNREMPGKVIEEIRIKVENEIKEIEKKTL